MITVRQFESRDAERVSQVLTAAFRSFLHERFDDRMAAAFAPDVLLRGAAVDDPFAVIRTFVAEEDTVVVGVIKVTAGTSGLGVLDCIGVDPACHARGIGAGLMARAEAFWTAHEQRKIGTCVSAHNKKALMYYLKHDFVPEGYRRDHFIEGVDEIILGRFLNRR